MMILDDPVSSFVEVPVRVMQTEQTISKIDEGSKGFETSLHQWTIGCCCYPLIKMICIACT